MMLGPMRDWMMCHLLLVRDITLLWNDCATMCCHTQKVLACFNGFLAGAPEAGKSTLMKQMNVVYGSGLTVNELRLYRNSIFNNLLNAMRVVIDAMSACSDVAGTLRLTRHRYAGRDSGRQQQRPVCGLHCRLGRRGGR